MQEHTTKPLTHDQLRAWGYKVCTKQNKFLPGVSDIDENTKSEIAGKCLHALSFPSDYFPLRILNQLDQLSEEAFRARKILNEAGVEFKKPIVILTARKMACLYEVLRQSGLDLSSQFDIISDRFIFLSPNLEYLKENIKNKVGGQQEEGNSMIYLVDDLSRRGEQIERRAENFKKHLDSEKDIITRRILINLRENPVDAENFRAVGGEDGAGMIRAYSRTFARALVPYFTDFPISNVIPLPEDKYETFISWLTTHAIYEVTSSVGIDERLRCYTLDARTLIDDEKFKRQLEECCHIIKLRFFIQAPPSPGSDYLIRVMAKPVLRDLAATKLCKVAQERKLLDKYTTYHQLGQVFGYLEYLLSWEIIEHVFKRMPNEITRRSGDSVVDEKFAKIVLGEKLLEHAMKDLNGSGVEGARSPILKDIRFSLFRENARHPVDRSVKEPDIHILGDDIIQPIDQIVSDYTRQNRDGESRKSSAGRSKDWRRLGFRNLVTKANKERGTNGQQSLSEFQVGLALDILTDWGRIVPDQQAVRGHLKAGREDLGVLNRLAMVDLASSSEHVRIQRCFRAGEITASIRKMTLTGGRLSTSALSWKRPKESEDRIETSARTTILKLEPWLRKKKKVLGLRDASPRSLLSHLLLTISMLPGVLRRETPVDNLQAALTDVRNSYFKLLCPVFAMAEKAVEVEFAGEILRYFNHAGNTNFDGTINYESSDAAQITEYTGFRQNDSTSTNQSSLKKLAFSRLFRSESLSWSAKHIASKTWPSPWNFGAFRRIKRAVLAVDTLLAFLQPLIPSDSDFKMRVLQCADSYSEGSDLRARLSDDVWSDWVSRLASPPAPLRFSRSQVLENNQSYFSVAVACSDLLGDVWHALTHAGLAVSLEIGTDQPFVTHRDRLRGPVLEIWNVVKEWYKTESSRRGAKEPQLLEATEILEKSAEPSYSPFSEKDSLLTVEQIVGQRWEFRSGGHWAILGHSELRHLVNSGRIIEVIDWQGGKRYPSFQFTPFCLREGLFVRKEGGLADPSIEDEALTVRYTDDNYPFLRRDISESMMGSSLYVSGWRAALWFHSMLNQVGEEPGASGSYNPRTVGYRGSIFEEALSQKGLWISHWLADSGSLIRNVGEGLLWFGESPGQTASPAFTKLYRITRSSYLHPNWWTSSAVFNRKLKEINRFRERTVSERETSEEPFFAPGRFDPGKPGIEDSAYYGVLYLAESVKGCVLEVFDREIAITLDDVVTQQIYEYCTNFNSQPKIRCLDLSAWPALVSATPVRSVTQAVANHLCYSGTDPMVSEYPKCIRYPLRTSLSEFGFAVFERTFFSGELLAQADDLNNRCGTANHDVTIPQEKVLEGETLPWLYPDLYNSSLWYQDDIKSRDYWRSLHSMRYAPRESVMCFRRFPNMSSGELGGII